MDPAYIIPFHADDHRMMTTVSHVVLNSPFTKLKGKLVS